MQAAAVFTCVTQSWSLVPLVFIAKGPFSTGREQSVWLLSSLPPQQLSGSCQSKYQASYCRRLQAASFSVPDTCHQKVSSDKLALVGGSVYSLRAAFSRHFCVRSSFIDVQRAPSSSTVVF